MKRALLAATIAVGVIGVPLMADPSQEDFRAEVARIYHLKEAGRQAGETGDLEGSEAAYRQAYDAQVTLFGDEHPETMVTMRLLAEALSKQERFAEACGILEKLIDHRRHADIQVADGLNWAYVSAALGWAEALHAGANGPPNDLEAARNLALRVRQRSPQPTSETPAIPGMFELVSNWIEAWTACAAGDPRRAIKLMEPGIVALNRNTWGYLASAWFAWHAGDHERARDWYFAAAENIAEQPDVSVELRTLQQRVASTLFSGQSEVPQLELPAYVDLFDRLLSEYPDAASFHFGRGVYAAHVQRWEQAASDLRKAVELLPDESSNWYHLALIECLLGREQAYKQCCEAMFERFAQSTNPFDRHLLLIASTVAPDAGVDPAAILELAKRPDRVDDSRIHRALYRLGRLQEVLSPATKEGDTIIVAMTQQRLGNTMEAERLLAECRHGERARRDPVTDYFLPEHRPFLVGMEFDLLLREAEQLIEPAPKRSWREFSQTLVGTWSVAGSIGGEDPQIDIPFTMQASFHSAALGRAVVGTQSLKFDDPSLPSMESVVTFGWNPADQVVQVLAYWSNVYVEHIVLDKCEENTFTGQYTVLTPTGDKNTVDIALEMTSNDQFSWIIRSGPREGKCLSTWQRRTTN
jgi:tetratricopeptide (TPR) repeat protein